MTNRTTLKVALIAMAFMFAAERAAALSAGPIVSDSSSVGYSDGAAGLDSIGPEMPLNLKLPHDDLYQHPYSMWRSCPNWKRIWQNTAALFGAGFATLGILELLPENTTAWNKASQKGVPFFRRWWNHAKRGPVWDSDLPLFNYILHPYAGGAYYMGARSQGLNVLGSLAYVTFISTCFWEYGIECLNEVPSIQDLIITPLSGAVVGEAFYRAKRHIVANDYRLLGSPVLGNIVVVIIDPVNEVLGFIFGNSARQWNKYNKNKALRLQGVTSQWGPVAVGGSSGFGLTLNAVF